MSSIPSLFLSQENETLSRKLTPCIRLINDAVLRVFSQCNRITFTQ